MEPLMEPYEVARMVFDRVMYYCIKEHDNPLECVTDHSPDQLSVFIDSYLTNEENEELEKAIEKSDTFWDDVEKEYEAMWKEWFTEKLAYSLGHLILEDGAKYIMEDEKLDNASKARLLKAYAKELKEFADVVKQALQNKKPLSSSQLYKWFKKLVEAEPSHLSEYIKDAKYYLDYYQMLDDADKLRTLDSLLKPYINSTLYRIEQNYLPELEASINTR